MADFLQLENLRSGYGEAVVIDGISFGLSQGQALAILGRNGTGKTTLMNSIIGVTCYHGGTVKFGGRDITRLRPESRAHLGIGWAPQERNIFKSLTVEENMTAVALPGPWNLARSYNMFPRLKERRTNLGSQLSGGEQQMLAVARALMLNPKLLLLDEPTEGLAPIIVEELLQSITRLLRDEGLTAIIIEQHAQKILKMTDQAIILDRGRVVHAATSAELAKDSTLLDKFLGVANKQPA